MAIATFNRVNYIMNIVWPVHGSRDIVSSIVENVDVETRQLDFLVAIFHITYLKDTFSIFGATKQFFHVFTNFDVIRNLKSEITSARRRNWFKKEKITNRRNIKKNISKQVNKQTNKPNRFPIYVILINANSCGPSCQWIDFILFLLCYTATG